MIVEKNEMKLLMLLSGAEEYILNDQFTTDRAAGAVDGTPAEPGPGIRNLLADSGNNVSIGSGKLDHAGGISSWSDPLLIYDDIAIARAAGQLGVFHLNRVGSPSSLFGFTGKLSPTTGPGDWDDAFRFGTSNLQLVDNETDLGITYIAAFPTGEDWYFAIALRTTGAYFFVQDPDVGKWILLDVLPAGDSDPLYWARNCYHANQDLMEYITAPEKLWLPSPHFSDSFGTVPTIEDSGGNGLDGTATKVGLGGPPPGKATDGGQAWFNGDGFVDIYSAGLNTAFDGQEGGAIVRVKVDPSVYSNGVHNYTVYLKVDGSNRVHINFHSSGSRVNFDYVAGGTAEAVSKTSLADLDWMTLGMTWSKVGDAFKAFYNGAQEGATQTGLGTFAGSLLSTGCAIGSDDITPSNPMQDGFIRDFILVVNGVVPSDADQLAVHNALDAGTLTAAALDGYFGAGNWAWWKLDDATFDTAVDSGSNGLDGTYNAVSINDKRGFFDQGVGSYVDVYSSELNSFFDPTLGTIISRAKVKNAGMWTNGTHHTSVRIAADSNNHVIMEKHSNDNTILVQYLAGGVSLYKSMSSSVVGIETWGMTWDVVGDKVRAYLNGAQSGADLTGLGTWAGALSANSCVIGAYNKSSTWPFSGWIGDVILSNQAASTADMLAIHVRLAAGTLTVADLNGYFGAGNWAWWKIDEQSQSDGLGHQEGIAGGRGAGGAGLPWLNRTNHADAAGKWKNAPVAGAELLSNTGFDNWTADDPDDWTVTGESGSDPEVSEVATGEAHADAPTPGGSMANLYTTGTYVDVRQTILTPERWYRFEVVVDTYTSGSFKLVTESLLIIASLTDSAVATFRCPAGDNDSMVARSSSPCDVTLDNVSVKELLLIDLLAVKLYSSQDVLIDADLVVSAGSQAGVALNWDDPDSPFNGVIAYHDGTNAKLEKCVAGVWTEVISAAATYSANAKIRVIKDGTSYHLQYNGAKVGSISTISDAGIKDNKYHGTFNTYISNTVDDVIVRPRGSSNEYGYLDRYI